MDYKILLIYLLGAVFAEECHHPADIVFVLDESGSIWGEHFKDQLTFVSDVIADFDVTENQTHVGVETFANYARVHFHLGDMTSQHELNETVMNITQRRGETGTAIALERLREDMFSPAHARSDVPHIAIVITDGESDDPIMTAIEAAELHALGVTVFAIGVGVINDEELYAIASSEQYVHTVEDYTALEQLKDILADDACKVTTPQSTTPDTTTTTTTTERITTTSTASPTTTTTLTTTLSTTTKPQNKEAKCLPVDVIFSVPDKAGIRDMNTSLTFIRSFLSDLDIGQETVRIGLTPRLCDDEPPIPLNGHDTVSGYKRAVRNRELTSTRISRQVEQMVVGMGEPVPPRGDLARNAARIAVLMMDNASTDPDLAVEMAELARQKDIRVVVIGIGDHVVADELVELASGDDWHHVNSYNQLPGLYDKLFDVICRSW